MTGGGALGLGRLVLESSRLGHPQTNQYIEANKLSIIALATNETTKSLSNYLQIVAENLHNLLLERRWSTSTKSKVYNLARFFHAQNHIFMTRHVGHPFTKFVKGGRIINTATRYV